MSDGVFGIRVPTEAAVQEFVIGKLTENEKNTEATQTNNAFNLWADNYEVVLKSTII